MKNIAGAAFYSECNRVDVFLTVIQDEELSLALI